jgi:hypothetical protein
MKRETSLLAAVFFLAGVPLMMGQDPHNGPSPVLPSDILGPQLIAWSQLQKPQPVQQTDQDQGQSAAPPAQEQPQSPVAQTLTGTIVKDGNSYVLKVATGTAYQLDDQDMARKYEGKQVRIAGTLDAKGNSFHVISIELIS